MIVDIHTHTFPDTIATHAINTLKNSSGMMPATDGTIDGLIASMEEQGIDYSVILPIVTKPSQLETINRVAIETNEKYADNHIISFGSIHPDNTSYRQVCRQLAANGVKGIKLHPVFQGIPFDDIRYMRIVEAACYYNLTILVHGGYDASFPGVKLVTHKEIENVLRDVRPVNMIMAHMGAWGFWEEIAELLTSYKIMMDTSFALTVPTPTGNDTDVLTGAKKERLDYRKLTNEMFCKMVRLAGAQNVFFGSDSPWNRQDVSADAIRQTSLTDRECDLILGLNAKRLLKIN